MLSRRLPTAVCNGFCSHPPEEARVSARRALLLRRLWALRAVGAYDEALLEGGDHWRAARGARGPFALIVVGQEAFRLGYYLELLPNTYTPRMTGMPLPERIKNGMNFVAPFMDEVRVLLVLMGTALLLDFRRGRLLLAGVFAAALPYQVWVGGDAR